jgi:peptide/nickel transport system ATP-binding protein
MAVEQVLKIRDLRIESIKGLVLVNNISLELKRGEVLGLIGESGAGKSTIGIGAMAYTRAGCRITGGTIEIDGVSVRDLTAEGRRGMRGHHIAYIAQSAAASFNPSHTILDQVCEMPVQHGLMNQKEAEEWAVELFKALDLPNPESFGARYPHQVSGGQLQRAMTAMAMSCRPDILVFDEPTTALDVTTQIEVLALIKKVIRDYNLAALYITHDLAVVAQVSDRIMVLRGGNMIELGATSQILSAPNDPYTRALVSERKQADKLSSELDKPRGEIILDVKNALGEYGSFKAVNDVSLNVAKGETVAVVGESGSGKSSLARLIVGLLPRKSGSVKFRGNELSVLLKDRSKEDLRQIQFIYQLPDVALNPRQTIGEIIGRPVAFYFNKSPAEVAARVSELLRQVGLPEDYAGRLSTQLSGGQKQRITIARALLKDPELLIFDEATSALDKDSEDAILLAIEEIKRNKTLIIVSHKLSMLKNADKILHINNQTIQEVGLPALEKPLSL